MHFFYFAYGSNLFPGKLKDVTPSASIVGTGYLDKHELNFYKTSQDGSGKCNIVSVADTQKVVWGVVYKISSSERTSLQESEGGYHETPIKVVIGDEVLDVVTFIANPSRIDETLIPYDWYKEYCLRGAIQHRLPQEYIERYILEVHSKQDPDEQRRAKHFTRLQNS